GRPVGAFSGDDLHFKGKTAVLRLFSGQIMPGNPILGIALALFQGISNVGIGILHRLPILSAQPRIIRRIPAGKPDSLGLSHHFRPYILFFYCFFQQNQL
ncbi:MAG: hypothetical protein IKV63_07290, partial [Clostridia bacterium]|nr:hypothetical protein [Clostridia bacterium]